MLSPKVVLLIFVSGKVVITGAKNEKALAEAMEKIHPTLEEYRKTVLTHEQQAQADAIEAEKDELAKRMLTDGAATGATGLLQQGGSAAEMARAAQEVTQAAEGAGGGAGAKALPAKKKGNPSQVRKGGKFTKSKKK
jgi:hypothetical protein